MIARCRQLIVLLAAVVVLPTGPVMADSSGYRVAPPPDWVRVHTLSAAELEMEGAANDGALYLLSDTQQRWDGRDAETYYRVVTKVVEPEALSDASSLQFSYDPEYQSFTLHSLRVRRGGRDLDRLSTARIDLLQREESLERRLLDGQTTVSIELHDVRVGDLVDYAYTRSGTNPVWRGHHFDSFPLEYGVPVGVIRVRVATPADRRLTAHYINGELPPQVTTSGGETVREWLVRGSEGSDPDSETPDWYLTGRRVQLTSFRSWREVAQIEAPLFAVPERVSPELRATIDRIRGASTDPKQRLREILDFAQREIRYLGIELGVGGYVPRDPSLVVARRFGDCKDKTLLVVTMARAVGIEAFPAIVDTSKRIGANGIAPDPSYFDHVIVLARIGGESFWLDPTRALQSGSLDRIFQPSYAEALVLEPGADSLTGMREYQPTDSMLEIEEVYDLSPSFGAGPSDFRVTSRYQGYRADSLREELRRGGADALSEKFFNYYKRRMPTLRTGDPMVVEDDPDANVLSVVEHYRIGSPWRWDAEEDQFEFSVSPYEIESLLGKPNDADRTAPYGRTHPADVTQRTRVVLPFERPVDSGRLEIEHPAFRFTKETRYERESNSVVLEYHYRSLSDAVEARDVDSYLEKVREADHLGWYWVSTRHLSERGPAKLFNYGLMAAFVYLGYLLLLPPAWFVYRRFKPSKSSADELYFPVGPGKFLLMSALTLGFYVIYWGYRNWRSVAERSPDGGHPKLAGFFIVFTCFWLFRAVNRDCAERGVPGIPHPWAWALLLLFWQLASAGLSGPSVMRELPVFAAMAYPALLNVVSAAILLPCVNRVTQLNPDAVVAETSRFRLDSWLAVALSLPFMLLSADIGRPTRDITVVSPHAVAHLEDRDLLEDGERVEAFGTPNVFLYRNEASVVTDRKLLRYWASDDLSEWYSEKTAYADIASMVFERKEDETRAHFVRKQGDSVDLYLPGARDRIVDVIERIVDRAPDATVSYEGMDPL